jgi:ABC-type sugar transport system ATPase subunit
MRTPTTAQLRTAVEVLKKLEERIGNYAIYSTMQLSEAGLGEDHAARIESQTIEQFSRVKTVMAQLESWRDELKQERRQCVTHHL